MESKKKQDALAQLIRKLDGEEEKTWASQFITACMLHPTKGDDGEIQDIEAMDGVMHFLTIGWKLFFAFIPPAHYYGGMPCFFISLTFIGIVTYVVGELLTSSDASSTSSQVSLQSLLSLWEHLCLILLLVCKLLKKRNMLMLQLVM